MRSPSTSNKKTVQSSDWVNLRDARGRVQARYNPRLRLLVIQDRRIKTLHDLSKHEPVDKTDFSVL